ncbi:MAG: metallophosphoesterase, partial [Pseudomonadota bacterium]
MTSDLVFVAGGLGATAVTALGVYALAIEPMRPPRVQHYRLAPKAWPTDLSLRLAILADLHAGEPWMSAARLTSIADQTNTLEADAILLLGDYDHTHPFLTRRVPAEDWATALARLSAPLGVHAVIGNHDWLNDKDAQERRSGPVYGALALQQAGIEVHENQTVLLKKDGQTCWLAGLGDQYALKRSRWTLGTNHEGVDDLAKTLAQVTDDAPIILIAHEPDIFPDVTDQVALTVLGHTHGGQMQFFGFPPVVPSRYGRRYAYGHIVENDRHLVVSGGLGCSGLP